MSDDEPGSIAQSRSRRSRVDKSGRQEALERFKRDREGGSKNKFDIKEVKPLYDYVDEADYAKIVNDRQKDDWIVDDGTGAYGYVEDGREIFDDDIIDHEGDNARKNKKPKTKKEKATEKAERESQRAGFQNIRDMFNNAQPVKRKRTEATSTTTSELPAIGMDDLLKDLRKDITQERKKPHVVTAPAVSSSFLSSTVESDDDEIVEIPRTTPTRVPVKAVQRKKFVPYGAGASKIDVPPAELPKKKYIPFGARATKKTDQLPSSTIVKGQEEPMDYYDDGPLHLDDYANVQSPPPSSPQPPKPTPKSSKEIKSTTTSEIPPKKVATPQPTSTSEKQPSKPKPVKKVKEIENFDSFGFISTNGNGTASVDLENQKYFEDGDAKILNFYWLDMFEEPKNPGTLYIFGKVQPSPGVYTSACLQVKDVTRDLFLHIRETMKSSDEEVDGNDVYVEFRDVIGPKYGIADFKSRPVRKKYCFDVPNIPPSSNYIEVRYSGSLPPLPADLEGESFSHVFGTGTPLLETFLLEKKLKGPSWLQIKNPEQVDPTHQHSWCKMEFTCSVSGIRQNENNDKMNVPPLVLASLNIQVTNDGSSKKDTIVFMGVAVHKQFELTKPLQSDQLFHDHFCILNKPPGEIWPLDVDQVFGKDGLGKKATKMDSERAMLGCFLAKLQQIDADIYLGHDLNFELLLLHLLNYKVIHWSRIGRLRRSNATAKNGKSLDYKSALAGRLFCDVKTSAMELIRARSYDFQSLVQQVLNTPTETLTGAQIKDLFDSGEGLKYLINWGMQHCVLNIKLLNELQVMPLALQITSIAGNTLFRTLLGGRSERNEYLLLHAFNSKDYIVPDKYRPFTNRQGKGDETIDDGGGGGKKKGGGPSYLGGMVLDPKKGFYDNFIILMDFNSLYPSIIQEYGICFTKRNTTEEDELGEEKGVLPEEIRKLVECRREVKKLMKGANVSQDQLRIYDIRQKALKLTANSMYGCLGFKHSRFYAKELAAKITEYGRNILLKTKDAVERMGFEVIYGDTDSIMINSNTKDIQNVYGIGNTIKAEINKMYRLLELEIDGIFRFLLLLKKKKYAALIWNQKSNGEIETVLELKGLDMVRRDWAPIASNTAKLVLDEIMTEQPIDEKIFKICRILNEISEKLRAGDVVLKDLLITKQLAKNPEDYKDAQGLYHVQVALNMNKNGNLGKKFKVGDTVPYLFCTDALPHHLTELSANQGTSDSPAPPLEPDPNYYLAQQIHPVVSRICEPMEGLDPARIADALGLDSTAFKKRRVFDDSEEKALGQESDVDKYADCEKFSFRCPNESCKVEIKFESTFTRKNGGIDYALRECPSCAVGLLPFLIHIKNRLTLFLRKFILKYYKNEFICEDPVCDGVERGVDFHLINGYPECRRCKAGLMCKDMRDSHLYKQISFLYSTFDIDKQKQGLSDTEKETIRKLETENGSRDILSGFEHLKSVVARCLESSSYSEVKLAYLFQGLFPKVPKLIMKKEIILN